MTKLVLDAGLQRRLLDKGYYTGTVDGHFGKLSFGGLIAFAAGRAPDGETLARGEVANEKYAEYGLLESAELIAEFLAQCSNECNMRCVRENMNYSAQGILSTWGPGRGSRVKNLAEAQKLARKPQALANVVYARPEEGNTGPNDGWLFRGAFDIQLTFKNNWKASAERLKVDLIGTPEASAKNPKLSHLVALDFWRQHKVNDAVRDGDFDGARRITNMGNRYRKDKNGKLLVPIGLTHVRMLRNHILSVLVA